MSTAIQVRMTANDFVRVHGDESGVELVNGEIRRIPMPGSEHGEVNTGMSSSVSLVIEVRQPADTIPDVCQRAAAHLRAGVRVVLVLDPNTASAALFRPDELPQRFHNGDALTIPDVLPGFSVPVAKFFE